MNDNLTLVILAAGWGSRFGKEAGQKQISSVGPNGELLIDYSIYDAIKAGFTKIVLIIKEDQKQIFEDKIISKWGNKVNVTYAVQSKDKYLDGYEYMADLREKPWGTVQAIMCAEDEVKGNFCMINADDFYGYEAYENIVNELKNIDENDKIYPIVGYKIGNVMSKEGEVKRGLLIEENNKTKALVESKVSFTNDNKVLAKPLNGDKEFIVEKDSLTSLNMIGFTKTIFPILKEKFSKFLEANKDNYLNCEYLISDVLKELLEENIVDVKVIPTDAHWIGMTYQEELYEVQEEIKQLVKNKKYPNNLYR